MRRSNPLSTRLRNKVHLELTGLLTGEGALATAPLRVRELLDDEDLIAEMAALYRLRTPPGSQEGKAAILTAGVPGAGKSSAVGDVAQGYFRIDPDEIKNLILSRMEQLGLLVDRHRFRLADGSAVSPGELSGWVHQASTAAANLARTQSLMLGENFLMEGTLQWPDLATLYPAELRRAQYEQLRILDVEVPKTVAVEQAKQRWWDGRTSAASAHGVVVGGRFISREAVESFYTDGGASVCAGRAREMFAAVEVAGLSTDIAFVHRDTSGAEHAALLTSSGEVAPWPGTGSLRGAPLGAACTVCGKAMTDPESIRLGVGPTCRRK